MTVQPTLKLLRTDINLKNSSDYTLGSEVYLLLLPCN
jgi:hypothetical protein